MVRPATILIVVYILRARIIHERRNYRPSKHPAVASLNFEPKRSVKSFRQWFVFEVLLYPSRPGSITIRPPKTKYIPLSNLSLSCPLPCLPSTDLLAYPKASRPREQREKDLCSSFDTRRGLDNPFSSLFFFNDPHYRTSLVVRRRKETFLFFSFFSSDKSYRDKRRVNVTGLDRYAPRCPSLIHPRAHLAPLARDARIVFI